jgi:hypothetical protein
MIPAAAGLRLSRLEENGNAHEGKFDRSGVDGALHSRGGNGRMERMISSPLPLRSWKTWCVYAGIAALSMMPFAGKAQNAATSADITEVFVTLDFNLPTGLLLGPTQLGDLELSWVPPNGAEQKLPLRELRQNVPFWQPGKKMFGLRSTVRGANIPVGSKIKVALLVPVLITSRAELGFVEIASPVTPIPEDAIGSFYLTGEATVREVPANVWKSAGFPAVKRVSEYFYLLYQLPKDSKLGIGKGKKAAISIAQGRGTDVDKLNVIGQTEGSVLSLGVPDSRDVVLYGRAPALPPTATSDIRAVTKFNISRGKDTGEVTGLAAFPPNPARDQPYVLGGKVAKLDAREKWIRNKDKK